MYQRMAETIQGLTEEQLLWRPALQANCIAEIAFHTIYGWDRLFNTSAGLGQEIWISQQWYKRFGYPSEFASTNWIPILREYKLPTPRVGDLLAYMEAIYKDSLDKLNKLSPTDLDRTAGPKNMHLPVGFHLRHIITSTNNHHGQIDYIRGLIDPSWDLKPGTGIIQS